MEVETTDYRESSFFRMTFVDNIKSITKWTAIGLSLFLAVWGIRSYIIESVHLTTNAMEATLHSGDFLLVNKIRLGNAPKRNAILLFTSPLAQDTLSEPLLVSRNMAMPGDTIIVDAEGYNINGKRYSRSPNTLGHYEINRAGMPSLLSIMDKQGIKEKDRRDTEEKSIFTFTRFEAYRIKENLPDIFKPSFKIVPTTEYRIIVPRKGRAYALDSLSLSACKEAIRNEAGEKAILKDGKLYLDGKQTNYFFFKEDYYWLLSDNTVEAVDSRHLGFIPESRIIGNIFFCWFSKDKGNRFKKI